MERSILRCYARGVVRVSRVGPPSILLLLVACSCDTTKDSAAAAQDAVAQPSVCKVDEVHALAKALESGGVETRKAKVADGLRGACTLPEGFTAFLASTEPDAAAEARFEAAASHSDLLEGICDNPQDVSKGLSSLKPRERAPMIFDTCGLGRLGVVERDAWLQGDPSSVVPFAIKPWLEAQGVDAADATVIASNLALRDRKLPTAEAPSPGTPKADAAVAANSGSDARKTGAPGAQADVRGIPRKGVPSAGGEDDVWGGLVSSDDEPLGVGGLGLVGSGVGEDGPIKSRVRQGKAEVKGALDKDIIRRIVRAHINEVRRCHEVQLKTDSTLAGKLEVSFTIGADGRVSDAELASDDLGTMGACVVKAVKRWKFPKPKSGSVAVRYPFTFAPE